MSDRERVAVVVDGGSSMREEFPEVERRGVRVIPLFLEFPDGSSYLGSNISDADFYRKMGESKKALPKTSGGSIEVARMVFEEVGKETDNILAISITARHSNAYTVATLGFEEAKIKIPTLNIKNIDSKNLSIASWFLAEQAADMSKAGASFEDIYRVTMETIPKLETEVVLNTVENIVKGGRLTALEGLLGTVMQVKPIIGVFDGEIRPITKPRRMSIAMRELADRAKGRSGEIVRLAVVHANNPNGAEELAELVAEFYPRKKIRKYEVGPVIGVHTGPGALAIVVQRK